MDREAFIKRVNYLFKLGLEPDREEIFELIQAHNQFSSDATSPLSADEHAMYFQIMGVNITKGVSPLIESTRRSLKKRQPSTPRFIEAGSKTPAPYPKTYEERQLASHYFEHGLRLGALKGSLFEPSRLELKRTKQKQSTAGTKQNRTYQSKKSHILPIIQDYIDKKFKGVEKGLDKIRQATGLEAHENTFKAWVKNLKERGDIFCYDPSARMPREKH